MHWAEHIAQIINEETEHLHATTLYVNSGSEEDIRIKATVDDSNSLTTWEFFITIKDEKIIRLECDNFWAMVIMQREEVFSLLEFLSNNRINLLKD
jgi:hypothetical protein